MTIHRALFAITALLLLSGNARAQVDTWAVTYPQPGIGTPGIDIGWSTLGSSSGATVASLPYLCIGGIAMSSDRSTFYVLAESELLRFDTATRAQLPALPAPVSCRDAGAMYISPDDRWWYFLGRRTTETRYQVVDALTRAVVLDVTTEPNEGFVFSPDGRARFELVVVGYGPLSQPNAWRLRAHTDPQSLATAWEVAAGCDFCGASVTANNTNVYLQIAPPLQGASQLRAYDAATGTERTRTTLPDNLRSVKAGRDRLYAGGRREISGTCGENVLATLDPFTLAQRSIASFRAECPYGFSDFVLSQDESILYLATSFFSLRGTHTRAEAFASATFRPLAPGRFMQLPVHAAKAIGPPAPEIVALQASSNGVGVRWQPAAGESPLAFAIRGARRGQQTTTVDETASGARGWESPPLPDGSYRVEVAALNLAGSSLPSAAVDFSVGNAGVPQAPINLVADTQADVSHLTWQPATAGPAPSEYIVQAAPAESAAFVDVVRVSMPELRATRIPAGSWDVRVRASTATGVSPPSNVVRVTSVACSIPPAAPMGLNAIVTERTVTLRWTASGSAEQYDVEAGTASGANDIGRLQTPNARPSLDVVAPPGVYFVRVRARNACGESDGSGEISVTVQ